MELQQLECIYQTYDRELAEANRKASIFAGIFGQNSIDDPRYAPCNKAFYENTGNWVNQFAASDPEQEDMVQVCRFLMEAASKRLNTPTYWYTLVAQGYMKELIPQLTPESCRLLAKEYEALYPKRRRLPLQEDVYRMLAKNR